MEEQAEKNNHPIEGLMKTAMQSIKEMVDVNTVVGDAVETNDGTVIIPISQVACGFAAGGGEYAQEGQTRNPELPFAGGSGAGVSVKPMGFLVCRMNDVRLISVSGNHLAERMVDIAPQLLDKLENALQRNNGRRNHRQPMDEQ
ncbi:MAG TPA: GerW family sporulation protein [Syntrophomonadaceae bacterium]|nr:GerW family sporulation protein [Syntrophomonadaceae bacterium]